MHAGAMLEVQAQGRMRAARLYPVSGKALPLVGGYPRRVPYHRPLGTSFRGFLPWECLAVDQAVKCGPRVPQEGPELRN